MTDLTRLCQLCAASSAAFAQKTTVLRVVVVKTDNPAAYAQELEKGRQLMKSMGIPATIRVWQARFAGPEAGAVVASIEYPSMTAFAEADAKLNAAPIIRPGSRDSTRYWTSPTMQAGSFRCGGES
jgi:hypothetical protein